MNSGDIIGNYKIKCKLGKGSFGTVYKVFHIVTNQSYAMKIENRSSKSSTQLRNEYEIYKKLEHCKGVPHVHYFGLHDNHYYLILDLMGSNLQEIFEERGNRFSLKTCIMIFKRLLNFFESIHDRGIIFRDLKPENILVGYDNPKELYIVDFGMAKPFMVAKTHIAMETNKNLTGTARYASINTHLGYGQSRRDDLENMMYTVLYFLKGKLPWMGLKAATGSSKYKKIAEVKQSTSAENLTVDLPGSREWCAILKYIHDLQFEEKPNYHFISSIVDKIMCDYNFKDDKIYDWISLEYEKETRNDGFWSSFKKMF